jgi:apolipoprotein N-acyltransferase
VPVFVVVHRAGWIRIFFYGAFYGFASYALFNIWLTTWHPLAIFVVPTIYAAHLLVLFPVLKLADSVAPRHAYVFQLVAWLGYEYIKTLGFLGYPYGIIGYSQVLFLPLIQIADTAGVWGVSALVVFPSVYLGNALRSGRKAVVGFLRSNRGALVAYGVVFAGALVYGSLSQVDTSAARQWRVALVQQNVDPWRGGDAAYQSSLEVLTRVSREAIAEDPEIVIWSETSFVPSIDWHTRYRTSDRRYSYVRELRDFLKDQPVAYVIGNNDGQKRRLPTGEEVRVDYNATLLYRNGEIVDIYRKLRLVPFSEHFPYRGLLNWMWVLLQEADIHYYEAGNRPVVYEDKGVRFSTPICFEDTFGYLGRLFVREGADVLVNMSNDSWAGSVACAMQHMTMGVFRAVENRRSLVRSTNGGMTVIVDPNGRILQMMEPFVAGYLIGDVPVWKERTSLYTRWGDWLAKGCLWATLGLSAVGLLIIVSRSARSRRD